MKVDSLGRRRWSTDEVDILKARLVELAAQYGPIPLRGLYYRAEVAGLIGKSEQDYERIEYFAGELREAGQLPWELIIDPSRTVHKVTRWRNVRDFLADQSRIYHLDYWPDMSELIQVYVEKEALVEVLWPIANRFGLPLYATKGNSSKIYLHDAAEEILAAGKPTTFVYVMTDLDPQGMLIYEQVEDGLRRYARGADITVERLAVTRPHVAQYGLPTRATKMGTAHAERFVERHGRESVELEAFAPADLQAILADALSRHTPESRLREWSAREEADRREIERLARRRSHR